MENRIKEQQLDLFADRTSAATMRANQYVTDAKNQAQQMTAQAQQQAQQPRQPAHGRSVRAAEHGARRAQ